MVRRAVLVVALVVALTLALAALSVLALRETVYYPAVAARVGSDLMLRVAGFGVNDEKACEATLAELSKRLVSGCTVCGLVESHCRQGLSDWHGQVLSESPLDAPSARMANGVMVFESANRELAMLVCRETERSSRSAGVGVGCFEAGRTRPVR